MKNVFLIIAFIMLSTTLQAQIRHVKGIKSVEGNYLHTAVGNGFAFGYSQYFSAKFYSKASIARENGKLGGVDFSAYHLLIDGAYSVYSFKEMVYINLIGGLSLGYYNVDNESYRDAKKTQYGLQGGIEIETFINDQFIVLTTFRQLYDLNEDYSKDRYLLSAGIKYAF